MTNNRQPNQTDVQQVRKQNQQSMQKMQGQAQSFSTNMGEEFGSETNVAEVKKQNQQSEANKFKASGQRANQFENGSR